MSRTLSTVILCLAVCANVAQAQLPPEPDQVALAKRFLGVWRFDLAKDTSYFERWEPLGDSAFVDRTWYTVRGDTVKRGVIVWGYDPNERKLMGAGIGMYRGRLAMWAMWFTSDSTLEGFNYRAPLNPSASISRPFRIEFKAPDAWIQTNSYPSGAPPSSESFTRVKG